MPTCLLGLGSNLGHREATLQSALADITALPDVQLVQHSKWYQSQPVGGPADQGEFLNAAAVIETTVAPLQFLDELGKIELRLGRRPAERWSARTIDIDILLYGSEVAETAMLTLPHPRMSFRRFVLEPAAEIAPRMLHPTIGWSVERLLLHLNAASDLLALVSPSADSRTQLADVIQQRDNATIVESPEFSTAEHHWPSEWTTWLTPKSSSRDSTPTGDSPRTLPYAAAAFPKLSILIDSAFAKPADKLKWSTLVRQPGRGPTLRLQTSDAAEISVEALAAIAAVWPI
jgi:2-amino-4-hydroxy-6-hydroxymethyldihydropteridine diphosphokinase